MTNKNSIKYVTKFAYVDSNIIKNILQPNEQRVERLNKKCDFFVKLEKSILTEGIRNPVVITAYKHKIETRYGGSRLLIAQKYNLIVPAIIADFDNVFPQAEILSNAEAIRSKYLDQPKKVYFKPYGLNISGCAHYHLGEK